MAMCLYEQAALALELGSAQVAEQCRQQALQHGLLSTVRQIESLLKLSAVPTGRAEKTAATGFVIVPIDDGTGSLNEILRTEIAKARASGRQPYAYFHALWCGASRMLNLSLQDPRMADAFEGTHVIRFSIDTWGDNAMALGFNMRSVPIFFRLDSHGTPLDSIDGSAWAGNSPENMAGPLKRFFRMALS